MTFDRGLEGCVGVCHSAVWSSLSLEVFGQRLNGHLSEELQRDCWGGGRLAWATSQVLPNPRFCERATVEGHYCTSVYVTVFQHVMSDSLPPGAEESCCQPQEGLSWDQEGEEFIFSLP